jgi:hypothetical protein
MSSENATSGDDTEGAKSGGREGEHICRSTIIFQYCKLTVYICIER